MLRGRITEIFIKVNDFCNEFEHEFKKNIRLNLILLLKSVTEKLLYATLKSSQF